MPTIKIGLFRSKDLRATGIEAYDSMVMQVGNNNKIFNAKDFKLIKVFELNSLELAEAEKED